MNLKPIKNEADYKLALKRLEEVFDAATGTPESDEADILGLMIAEFEQKHYTIEAPDPIEAIKIRMEDLSLKQVDLINEIGSKSRVSEILNRRRKLTLEMIRNLSKRLNLSSELLISDYQLSRFATLSNPSKKIKAK
jgi:HTH-type transcriptional regulator/antitoxin HigA